jgi:hypothetical protein
MNESDENDQPTSSFWYILYEKRGARPPTSERITEQAAMPDAE